MNVCPHAKKVNYNKISYCNLCGTVFIDKTFSVKSKKYYFIVDQSPLIIFEKMKRSVFGYPINYIHPNPLYIKERSNIIKEIEIFFDKLNYSSQVFYLTIHYLDIVTSVTKDTKFKLMGMACLALASKFDQSDLNDFILEEMESKNFSMFELKKYEVNCLKLLNYKLNYYTPYHFISFFISSGYVFNDDLISDKMLSKYQGDKEQAKGDLSLDFLQRLSDKVYYNAKEVLYHFLDDPAYVTFSPLHVACSCISISRELNKIYDLWPLNLEKMYLINFDEFSNCFFAIQKSISVKKLPNSELSKYFSIRNDKKRISLNWNYQGDKILNLIENNESLNNLKANLNLEEDNLRDDDDLQEVKFIRESKKKQTIYSKIDVKNVNNFKRDNIESEFEQKTKIEPNKSQISLSTNSFKSDSKDISNQFNYEKIKYGGLK